MVQIMMPKMKKMSIHIKRVRPDGKGRITLGKLAEGISGFDISVDELGRIFLEPYTEIPAREKWLFDNKTALQKVSKGLEDLAAGRLSSRGSFSHFTDEDID